MNTSNDASTIRAGGCDCGGVRYEVSGPMSAVVNCHCGQCRRTHGHFAPYSGAASADLRFVEQRALRWYRSSEFARRGFCGECGASLFWARDGADGISIAAGTLDGKTGLETVAHIFMDDAGDYYTLNDDLPRHAGSMP